MSAIAWSKNMVNQSSFVAGLRSHISSYLVFTTVYSQVRTNTEPNRKCLRKDEQLLTTYTRSTSRTPKNNPQMAYHKRKLRSNTTRSILNANSTRQTNYSVRRTMTRSKHHPLSTLKTNTRTPPAPSPFIYSLTLQKSPPPPPYPPISNPLHPTP